MRYLAITKEPSGAEFQLRLRTCLHKETFFRAHRFSLRRKGKGCFKIPIQGFSIAAVEGFCLLLDQVKKSLAPLPCCFTAAGWASVLAAPLPQRQTWCPAAGQWPPWPPSGPDRCARTSLSAPCSLGAVPVPPGSPPLSAWCSGSSAALPQRAWSPCSWPVIPVSLWTWCRDRFYSVCLTQTRKGQRKPPCVTCTSKPGTCSLVVSFYTASCSSSSLPFPSPKCL